MSTIIGGSSPSITFSDSTTQTTAFTGSASQITSGTLPSAQLPTGSVLQVVQATASSASTSSTSFVTTGLTASITPKFSTSKILVIVSLAEVNVSASNKNATSTIYRNGSNIAPSGSGIHQAFAAIYAGNSVLTANQNYSYLDSPATTSSTTYTIYFATESGASVTMGINSTTSYIQLLEVAG